MDNSPSGDHGYLILLTYSFVSRHLCITTVARHLICYVVHLPRLLVSLSRRYARSGFDIPPKGLTALQTFWAYQHDPAGDHRLGISPWRHAFAHRQLSWPRMSVTSCGDYIMRSLQHDHAILYRLQPSWDLLTGLAPFKSHRFEMPEIIHTQPLS